MMNQQPLVSVIVPTKNSTATLEACLQSIRTQTYSAIELIVVDNFSTDGTQELARKYADKVFEEGPERSAQRNYGVDQATGEYVAIIDSDMVLSERVIESCVHRITADASLGGVIIPEESFGEGFWAQCKKLERSFYVGVSWMEAARFFKKEFYQKVGGYNAELVSGEDWDLSQRIEKLGSISRVDEMIFHNEGKLALLKTLKKKYYYAQHFAKYLQQNHNENQVQQTGVIGRYKLFFAKPGKLFAEPLVGLGMLFMKTCEFGVGFAALYLSKSAHFQKLDEFMNGAALEDTTIVGFYGGTNFGDELLLEVLQEKLSSREVSRVHFYYSRPDLFSTYHNNFGYSMVSNPRDLLKAMFQSKNILIGGGGLWGVDFNSRIFFLSLALFIFRFLLQKKVYLLGVGYYNSAPPMGRVAALLAGKAANQIYVRDNESFKNFSSINRSTLLDTDIAYLLNENDYSERKYSAQLSKLDEMVIKPAIVVSLRGWYNPHFRNAVGKMIEDNPATNFIVTLLENERIFLPNHEFALALKAKYKNVVYLDFTFNPLELFAFFYKHRDNLKIIAPQLHAQIMANIVRVSFLPVYYDNKNLELFKRIGVSKAYHMDTITSEVLSAFVESR